MNTDMQIFSFKGAEVRIEMIGGEPWFVAKDVCDVLGIANHRDAVASLDDDEKGVANTDTPGGEQAVSVVSESGLYALTFKSRKKEAKAFRKHVTAVVLPSIRKTGSYGVPVLSEVDKLAMVFGIKFPEIVSLVAVVEATVEEQGDRLALVEERQRITDPREIEKRMAVLHDLRNKLVEGTATQMVPITHRGYWDALKRRFAIGSFQHRAALTVPLMDEVIEYARGWLVSRGLPCPSLFEATAAQDATPVTDARQ